MFAPILLAIAGFILIVGMGVFALLRVGGGDPVNDGMP